MLKKTDFDFAPWFVVDANDKEKAHMALLRHILGQLNYKTRIFIMG